MILKRGNGENITIVMFFVTFMDSIFRDTYKPFLYGVAFFLAGLNYIIIPLKFKIFKKLERLNGRVVNVKYSYSGKTSRAVPIVKFEYNGNIYKSPGYSNTINPVFDMDVNVYYDEKKYPDFVFIDNGFKDYIQGIIYMLIGLPFSLTPLLYIYDFHDEEFSRGIYLSKLDYCLPKCITLIIAFLVLFILFIIFDDLKAGSNLGSYKTKIIDPADLPENRKKRILTEEQKKRDIEYLKHNGIEKPGRVEPHVFASGDKINRDDRLLIYYLLKDGEKHEAVKLYMEQTGVKLEEAVDAVEEYEKFL